MDDKLTIFIAVTAAAVVLQMLILAAMYFTMRRFAVRMQSITDDLQSRALPLLEDGKKLTTEVQSILEATRPKLNIILDNAAVVSTTARDQTQKIEVALNGFMDHARIHALRPALEGRGAAPEGAHDAVLDRQVVVDDVELRDRGRPLDRKSVV